MRSIPEMWRRWTSNRYTRLLESENIRLRAENRALLNSILGIAGIPPITAAPSDAVLGESEHSQFRARETARRARNGEQVNEGPGRAAALTPLRRRSWHQINRALEIDSARKKNITEQHIQIST